jgi:hypothetical protein
VRYSLVAISQEINNGDEWLQKNHANQPPNARRARYAIVGPRINEHRYLKTKYKN